MKKYIKDLTANEVIHVRTEEEAVQLTEKFHELGLEWRNSGSYKELNKFYEYKENTCYNPNKGTYSRKTYWEDLGATIYTIEDILDFQFTFPDKWALEKVETDEDSRIVSEYARSIGGKHWRDMLDFPKTHYLHVIDGEYERGEPIVLKEYTLVTLENFKKHILKQNNKMETKNRIITHDQAQRIIDIACGGWKGKLSKIWAENIVLKRTTDISEEFYSEMRKACTSAQSLVFDEIFGEDKKEFNSSMLKIGEFMFVNDEACASNGNRIVRSFIALVDIDSPNNTYDLGARLKGDKIESGSVLEVKVK